MSQNYEQMSDFEINCEVLRRIFAGEEGLRFTKHYRGFKEGHPLSGSVVCRFLDGSISTADFCRKPDDAWPIISENEMKIDPRRTSPKLDWMVSLNDQIYAVDKNPLRAAMICFLKLKDSESDHA